VALPRRRRHPGRSRKRRRYALVAGQRRCYIRHYRGSGRNNQGRIARLRRSFSGRSGYEL